MKIFRVAVVAVCLLHRVVIAAEVVHYAGSPEALAHEQYINVVPESVSPIDQVYIKSPDGAYIATAMRKPQGDGPFPAIILFHGAPGGRGMEQIVGWSRGDHGGPVWERFLQEGYVVIVADYRGGNMNLANSPSQNGAVSAIDDGIAIIDHVRALTYVDASRISVYGVSLGGNLAMFLAAKVPDLHKVVVGAPFPVWFLGAKFPNSGNWPALTDLEWDVKFGEENIAAVQMPVYILVGSADPLLPLAERLHAEMDKQNKSVRMEVYEHGYHDFVLGPQGHDRADLPRGEILLQGALDALDRTVDFLQEE